MATSPEFSRKKPRPTRHMWYFLAVGLVAGASMIVFATLPRAFAGLAFVVGAALVALIDFIARRASASPLSARLRQGEVVYLVVLGVVVIAAALVVWAVVGNAETLWVAWVMAGLVFVVAFIGTWATGRPSTTQTTSA